MTTGTTNALRAAHRWIDGVLLGPFGADKSPAVDEGVLLLAQIAAALATAQPEGVDAASEQIILDAAVAAFRREQDAGGSLWECVQEAIRATRQAQGGGEDYQHGGRPMTLREIMDAEDGGHE